MKRKKDFDAVAMMRSIRDKLSKRYKDEELEERELLEIRKKYGFESQTKHHEDKDSKDEE